MMNRRVFPSPGAGRRAGGRLFPVGVPLKEGSPDIGLVRNVDVGKKGGGGGGEGGAPFDAVVSGAGGGIGQEQRDDGDETEEDFSFYIL